MTLEIEGRVPSKKNSRQQIRVGGLTINIPSKAYAAWHKDASLQLLGKRPAQPLGHAEVTITIYAPDRRAADLTNKAESLMDLLVDNSFLADDNWHVVPAVTMRFGGVDRARPRAIFRIIEM